MIIIFRTQNIHTIIFIATNLFLFLNNHNIPLLQSITVQNEKNLYIY